MFARWFLALILLVTPLQVAGSWLVEGCSSGVRGAIGSIAEDDDPCGDACCPLCRELPDCPCNADSDNRPRPERRDPPRVATESSRIAPAPEPTTPHVAERHVFARRALRAQTAGRWQTTTNGFLSWVGVRTT